MVFGAIACDTTANASVEPSSLRSTFMSATLENPAPVSTGPVTTAPDFVSSDIAALASHMDRCASTRSRLFGVHVALESVHAFIFPRMVTAAVIATVLLGLVTTV